MPGKGSYGALPSNDLRTQRNDEQNPLSKGPFFGKRHWLVLTLTLLYETTHSVKVYMSVCIVAMTDPTASSNKDIPTYDWKNKGIILSGYLWGLFASQFLAGWIVSKFKAKWPIVFMLLLSSFVGFLIPTVASSIGSIGVAIIRVIQGATVGSISPFVYYLFGKWIPPSERSRLMGILVSGQIIGTAIALYLSGVLAATSYGWPLVIYFYSGLCLIWCIIFVLVVSNSPAEHPTITMEEKYYIEHSLHQTQKKKLITPYKKILTSIHVWVNIISRMGGYFGYFTILSEISIYLKGTLHVDIKDNGLLSAIPYICTIFLLYFFGFLSDLLVMKRICGVTTTRKIMAVLSCLVSSIFLIFLAQCRPGETVKVISSLVLMVSLDTAGAAHSTLINCIDLSPNHAGTLEGIINQIAYLTASLGPLLVQFIVSDEKTTDEWKLIFYIIAGVKILTGLMFLFFGSSEVQPWNDEICETESDHSQRNKDGVNLTFKKSPT